MGASQIHSPWLPDAIDTLLGIPVVDELDLAGYQREEVRALIEAFVARRAALGGGVVRITTGTTETPDGAPILRAGIPRVLAGAMSNCVRRFQSDVGGTAWLVDVR